MSRAANNAVREILREVQRRVPVGRRFVQEAFASDHCQPVLVKLNELSTDIFYFFDEVTACAFCEAVVVWAARHGGGRLTLSCPAFGELKTQQRRLQHIATKFTTVRALVVGRAANVGSGGDGIEVRNTTGTVLVRFRLALREGNPPVLFICLEMTRRPTDDSRFLGFFTCDTDTVDEVAGDVDLVARGVARHVTAFDRLQLLHQTTQQVTHELESYSRRMELAIRRAQRRPDLLTPARFDRILQQSVAKMEQLKEIPRRALRTMGRMSS